MISTRSCTLPAPVRRLLAAFLCGLAAPALAWTASLEWATETQSFETEFGDESVEATYPFTNTGDTPVTILETSASCGCTVPTLSKKVYEPGESGELNAIFTIGSRQGKQRKLITVVTENAEGSQDTYELKLEVDIPVPVTLAPRVRFWKLGAEASTQTIEITFHERSPMTLSGLARKDADQPAQFDYEIETVTEGLKYTVKLTPKSLDVKSRDTFLLVSEQDENDILKRYPIYAYVR
ncbi:DUF1573 domain-containing protein [Pelagicoccus sp. SDUM812005]|uniref:DUF1573 domain-containing protein n=1 Tax=Pelagicoccus sp. SDUM812005 TaxID=3041257 RepID=UPI00280EE74A|nr:DUF1573 domain-containing protein [Pelagicoccus sp. SDUM812005]MDQ8180879.1 DUF1573 domain-containing protein [Pelagicoccus sp. SDUM812005]